MKSKILVLFVSLVVVSAATNIVINNFELPTAKVTVKVVGENGQPIENANVSLGFGYTSTQGMTDSKGVFTGEGRCGITGIGSTIKKDGYYLGSPPIPRFIEHDDVLNHWKPWNKTYTAILRSIGKPIALYAKKVDVAIPALDKPCGFDLEAGDWVTPYGKGMKSDLIFTLHQENRGMQDYDVLGELTFKNPQDGLLNVPEKPEIAKNSIFRWERQAPENGYQAKFQLQNSWHKEKGITQSFKFGNGIWEGYFFRVRTVEQNGKIVSAHYGKIKGGIEVDPRWSSTCTVTFTYYYNPTPNDRNLEWDTKKNLFSGLTDMETPREP